MLQWGATVPNGLVLPKSSGLQVFLWFSGVFLVFPTFQFGISGLQVARVGGWGFVVWGLGACLWFRVWIGGSGFRSGVEVS